MKEEGKTVTGDECPICKGTTSRNLVRRATVPVMQNKPFASVKEARGIATGQLDFRQCTSCGFSWNAAFDPAKVVYDPSYENCQSLSPAFQDHLRCRIDRICQLLEGRGSVTIVEAGCGQGDFLADLVATIGKERISRAVGFDPAFHGDDGGEKNGCTIYKRLLTPGSLEEVAVTPDIVLSRHTIEHIAAPVDFLTSIRRSIGATPARLILETPTNSWILRHRVLHDFFYEHCSVFDMRSMSEALSRSGFEPTRIDTVFGGQYLWVEALASDLDETAAIEDSRAYQDRWSGHVADRLAAGDKIAVWGAGAKGVTFAGMIDPDCTRLDCIIDKNTAKQGLHVPMTGHPIVAPSDVGPRAVTHIIVMNPEYAGEIATELQQLGCTASVVVVE